MHVDPNGKSSLVLAVSTATKVLGAAVANQRSVLAERWEMAPTGHASRLPILVAEVMNEAGCKPEDLAATAAVVGPGSYTGVRIGVGFAAAFAWSRRLPTVAVGSLEALAWQVFSTRDSASKRVLALLDARRGRVYAGLYERTTNPGGSTPSEFPLQLRRMAGPDLLSVENLPAWLQAASPHGAKLEVVGDGQQQLTETVRQELGEIQFGEEVSRAGSVAEFAAVRLAQGKTTEAIQLEPFYLGQKQGDNFGGTR